LPRWWRGRETGCLGVANLRPLSTHCPRPYIFALSFQACPECPHNGDNATRLSPINDPSMPLSCGFNTCSTVDGDGPSWLCDGDVSFEPQEWSRCLPERLKLALFTPGATWHATDLLEPRSLKTSQHTDSHPHVGNWGREQGSPSCQKTDRVGPT